MQRGEVRRLPAPRGTRGHEQRGTRYGVEQLGAVDRSRLGASVGVLPRNELDEVERALATVLALA